MYIKEDILHVSKQIFLTQYLKFFLKINSLLNNSIKLLVFVCFIFLYLTFKFLLVPDVFFIGTLHTSIDITMEENNYINI